MDVKEKISQYTKKSRFNQLVFEWLYESNKNAQNSISNKCISLYYFEYVEQILDDIMQRKEQSMEFVINYINRDEYEFIIKFDGIPSYIIKKKEDLCLSLLHVNFLYYDDTFPGLADTLDASLINLGYDSIFSDISRYIFDILRCEELETDEVIANYEFLDIEDVKCLTLNKTQEYLEKQIIISNLLYERIKIYQHIQKDMVNLNNRIKCLEIELVQKDKTIDELTHNIRILEEKKKPLPEELSTHEMMIYWKGLQDKGIVDKYNQPIGKRGGPELAYIARCFFEKMNIGNQWSIFESFWGVSKLAQNNDKIRQQGWKKPIDIVFGKEDEITALKKKIQKL